MFAGETTNYKEINDTIKLIGVSLSDFNDLWPNYCKPNWHAEHDGDLVNTVEFTKNAFKSGFITAEFKNNKTKLSTGPVCSVLLDYYYDGTSSDDIALFINKDKLIIDKYGYSSIDLYKYSETSNLSYSTFNWSSKAVEQLERTISRFETNRVFDVEAEKKTSGYGRVNGEITSIEVAPYKVYYLQPSKEFKAALGHL